VPWIGPVIAPIAISVVLIICGVLITGLFARDIDFRPSNLTWVLAIVATAVVLFTFMCDTGAAFHHQLPEPYRYTLFLAGLVLYIIAFVHSYLRAVRHSS